MRKEVKYTDKAREVLDIELEGLKTVRDSLDENFDRATEIILKALSAKGKIVVTGIGKNLHVAQKLSATLASTGSTSVVLNPSQAMHGDLGILDKDDVMLVLSYSGESEELISLLPLVKRAGVPVVAMTSTHDSALAANSDAVICVKVEREACPFNMAPTTSTTATMAVGDALAMVLIEAQGFKKEDYAKLHPGGAIGRALLVSVADIMRTGDRIATVITGSKVKDALLAMTQSRSGSAGIVDKAGRVLGIFTDGDLRRHIATTSNLLDLSVDEVMTPAPLTVRPDQLAIDVLKIYEERNIDDLLVVDQNGNLVGAVDIQDLPKFKIM